jgi:hypothetical protein
MRITYKLTHAASIDAGNRSMRKGGRTAWNEDDYGACVDEFNRLIPEETVHQSSSRTDDTTRRLP